MLLHLILLSSLLSSVLGTQCSGESCDTKYLCSQGVGSVSAHEYSSPLPRSVFLSPCDCNDGWNDLFCSYPNIYSNSAVITPQTPTVCVCRKQSDSNLRCEQFLTRCYRRSEGDCKCCFMQDEEFCDQIECKDDHPQFQDVNTTCHCFSRPIDYPTQICDGYDEERRRMQQKSSSYHLSILGFSVSAFVVLAAVVAILCVVGCLTMGCLVISSNRRRRAREERERVQRERRERLGMPPEDESFLH